MIPKEEMISIYKNRRGIKAFITILVGERHQLAGKSSIVAGKMVEVACKITKVAGKLMEPARK